MSTWDSGPAGVGRLDERVVELLTTRPGRIAFNGLKRALDAHPESLARALKRLEHGGIVEREDGGYRLRETPGTPRAPGPMGRLETVASVRLPPGTPREALFGQIAGRWFGDSLRWLGVHERPGSPWLVWSLEGSSGHVLLEIDRGELKVWVERPNGPDDGGRLADAGRELLLRVLEHVRPVGRGTGSDGGVFPFARSTFTPHGG